VPLDENGLQPHYVLLANPNQITVRQLYDLLVVDRGELAYQANLDSTHVHGATLLAALENDKLDVTLAALVTARADERSAQRADEGARGAAAMPHRVA
jgi:membrane protein